QRPQDLVARYGIELKRASARQIREAILDRGAKSRARDPGERRIDRVEPELVAVLADEVEHQARRLARMEARTATELLQEQRRARGRPREQVGLIRSRRRFVYAANRSSALRSLSYRAGLT